MDLALHAPGGTPAWLDPLLAAAGELAEGRPDPDGTVVFCPDATLALPPAEEVPLVAMVGGCERLFTPAGRRELLERLGPWAGRGAILIAPTPTFADSLRGMLALPPGRVRSLALPLPHEERPEPSRGQARDVVVAGVCDHPTVLAAVSALRLMGERRRLVLADAFAGRMCAPGGAAQAHLLLGGEDVVAAEDWRAAAQDAAAIVVCETHEDFGWTLRSALATGRPVVAPSTPVVSDHLAAAGAAAHRYRRNPLDLAAALLAALRGTAFAGTGPQAVQAVAQEPWEPAAGVLLDALADAITGGGQAAPARTQAAGGGQGSRRVLVCNPWVSGGGGERFLIELVRGLRELPQAPEVTVVLGSETGLEWGPIGDALARCGAGVEAVELACAHARIAELAAEHDVVHCTWAHLVEPLDTAGTPLVTTLHDCNWRHFDVFSAEQRELIERQTPRWLAESAAVVHSARFIASEYAEFYGGAGGRTHVVPLATADPPPAPGPEAQAALRARFGLPERFVLSPAGLHLHKNYAVLLRALERLRAAGTPVPVVATGGAAERLRGPDLVGLGYVSTHDLSGLLAASCGVVQPSLYEAGSFPMLEAMAAGKPAAIAAIPAVLEQVRRIGLEALLFDPLDPDAVARALLSLLRGEGKACAPETLAGNRAAALQRTWVDVARGYFEVYEQVIAARTPAPC